MAKIFYCGGSSGPLGMLRAVIPVAELSGVLSKEKPKYVGKSFPKMRQTGPQGIVIEVLIDEQGQWKAGFYRVARGPLEFEDHLRAFWLGTIPADREEVALFAKNALLLDGSLTNLPSGLALPSDKTITISVLTGPSTGLTHRLTKAKTSIGQVGGGADIEINDPELSHLHCVVGVTEDMIRLCDLDSANGTYVNDERIQATDLEHLSEFRVGSTWLIVVVSQKHSTQPE